MSPIAIVIIAVFFVLLIINFIGVTFDKVGDKDVVVTSGSHKGREGRVVSSPWIWNGWHWWRATLNMPMSDAEKQVEIAEKLASGCGWKMPEEASHSGEDVVASVEHARTWHTIPRWRFKIATPKELQRPEKKEPEDAYT